MALEKKDIRALGIYGANIVSTVTGYGGNPLGATIFGLTRLAERAGVNAIDNKYVRLLRCSGAVLYSLDAVFSLGRGFYGIPQAVLSGAMALELGLEARESYRNSSSIGEDIQGIGRDLSDLVKD